MESFKKVCDFLDVGVAHNLNACLEMCADSL